MLMSGTIQERKLQTHIPPHLSALRFGKNKHTLIKLKTDSIFMLEHSKLMQKDFLKHRKPLIKPKLLLSINYALLTFKLSKERN